MATMNLIRELYSILHKQCELSALVMFKGKNK